MFVALHRKGIELLLSCCSLTSLLLLGGFLLLLLGFLGLSLLRLLALRPVSTFPRQQSLSLGKILQSLGQDFVDSNLLRISVVPPKISLQSTRSSNLHAHIAQLDEVAFLDFPETFLVWIHNFYTKSVLAPRARPLPVRCHRIPIGIPVSTLIVAFVWCSIVVQTSILRVIRHIHFDVLVILRIFLHHFYQEIAKVVVLDVLDQLQFVELSDGRVHGGGPCWRIADRA